MIVVEGTPGAGKTTMLGNLLEAAPERVVVFPEAQPRNAREDAVVTRAFIAEALHRAVVAQRLQQHIPGAVIASDRSCLGVLAYRHALWRTGRASRDDFDLALHLCRAGHSSNAHSGDTVLVLLLDPAASIGRRSRFADDPRYTLWYEIDFLAAYNQAMVELAATIHAGTAMTIDDITPWSKDQLSSVGLAVAGLTAGPTRVTARSSNLACNRRCSEPRSAVIGRSRVGLIQLYTSALHKRHASRTTCLRTAADIEWAYLQAGRRPARSVGDTAGRRIRR